VTAVAIEVIEILGIALAAAGAGVLVLGRRATIPEAGQTEPIARRQFLNRALVGALGVFTVAFGGGTVGFVWPNVLPGFGKKVRAGKLPEIVKRMRAQGVPYYNPEGRFYLVFYDTADPENRYVKAGVAKQGIMALYQKCAHLGCRVPFCEQSQWFECPCHGSKYNYAGEKMLGPASTGLWRFPIEIDEQGVVFVDTSNAKAQPELGADTIRRPPAGPFCASVEENE
jgi:cytochrome b6-f complex iron-sulfur subunit